ncbi:MULTISPECIES: type III secretion system gatekeeper subunit SctW [unclassified Pseudomonas]|jgi:type III secretion protein W|uniref:type III secretion system gatekeeper subunit SctW n=1 Tax=unclassified Pseudomonas TaxID=196821 RepID=UPI001CFB65E7|nr:MULTISPECIES: type III secretion system gatekeeper subunit SctW [unclassified Pseudomonas]WLH80069.1 type III secretion system gatekeeper subunit SctW [Pseudomonas sp. FP2335]
MKVESPSDVQKVLQQDLPNVDAAQAQTRSPGVDELAFNQDLMFNNVPRRQAVGESVMPIEQLAQLYDQLGHPAQAKLAAITRMVRHYLMREPSIDTLLEITGNDPARTFVVLHQVMAQAQAARDKDEARLAQDALARLNIRFKREIQAGLNIAMTLQAAGADPQERQAVRDLYYASVVTRQSLATMMKELLRVYGAERFSQGLKVMRGALSDDIAAHVPSVPTALLRSLLRGLQSCSQLSGVLSNCESLIRRLNLEQDAVSLLQRLLGYAGTGVAASEVQRLADDLLAAGRPCQLISLNALYPVIQQIPLGIWLDGQTRRDALHNFLLVMDEFARVERGPGGPVAQRRGL